MFSSFVSLSHALQSCSLNQQVVREIALHLELGDSYLFLDRTSLGLIFSICTMRGNVR